MGAPVACSPIVPPFHSLHNTMSLNRPPTPSQFHRLFTTCEPKPRWGYHISAFSPTGGHLNSTKHRWRSEDSIWGVVLSVHYVEPRVELRTSGLAANAFITKPSCWSLLLSGSSLPPTCRLLSFLLEGSLYITSLGQSMLPLSVITYWPSKTTGPTQGVSSSPSELNLECNQEVGFQRSQSVNSSLCPTLSHSP